MLLILIGASLLSWSIIFAKWGVLRKAADANRKFLRAFRKANALDAIALIAEQNAQAPLVAVFDFGYAEVERQARNRGQIRNKLMIERNLQLGISEEIQKLERSMTWLATIASVTPFIGLFGTVWGIIDAFEALSMSASVSLRTVGPGIADALIATGAGLAAAIPAAIAYNYLGSLIKDMGARMEDFGLEFLNLVERTFEG
ncbi:MotA/TolQ/ExbB proton channel family protein [Bryobacter aggregatus]|uniref:MotA/TolQ/ExbB proton channel family protein n=1 Tax=Bryobacter aggregatus TaxID=360054 RepID=UPI001EE1A348|nr:MotA/TolQ/ExbB proton channel family protein [Bryobacter aggregatus]